VRVICFRSTRTGRQWRTRVGPVGLLSRRTQTGLATKLGTGNPYRYCSCLGRVLVNRSPSRDAKLKVWGEFGRIRVHEPARPRGLDYEHMFVVRLN
jgi:hypothetical protein